jgi:hypothetical protein
MLTPEPPGVGGPMPEGGGSLKRDATRAEIQTPAFVSIGLSDESSAALAIILRDPYNTLSPERPFQLIRPVSGASQMKATAPIQAADSHPTAKHSNIQLKDLQKTLPLRVLSAKDWLHWITKGYVIVREAVPPANVERLVDLLWKFEEKDPKNPLTWRQPQRRGHKMKELNDTGMIEIYNHQYLWDNRQEPRVYDAFVDIWDREDLWVTIDRANLNPPKITEGSPRGFIHWDVDTSLRPLPIGVQGVLSLAKQDDLVGGFQCVPDLFRDFEDWAKTQPSDRDPMHPDTTGFNVENVEMEAGDLLIFNSLLAHGIRPNHSDNRVRIAQYISMYQTDDDNESERQERVRQWRELDHPRRTHFPEIRANGRSITRVSRS